MKKELHNAIAANVDAQPFVKWTDMWKNQVTKLRNKYPFNYPAAFISIRNIPWQDMTFNVKQGTATIDIYVFFDLWQDTFEGASDKNDSMAILDQLETVANDLHWLENDFIISELTQIGEEDLTDRYERPAHRLTFACEVRKQITPAIHVSN